MSSVRVLGDIAVVRREGRTIAITSDGPRLILAQLAMRSPGTATIDSLIDSLWSPRPPPSCRSSLRNMVSRLRHLLDEPGCESGIVHRGGGYYLASSVSVDAADFEREVDNSRSLHDRRDLERVLTRALGRWSGVAFAGLDGHAFVSERFRLEQLRVDALQRRQRALIALGRSSDGMGDIREAVEEHPFDEELVELAMVTHYLCGQQAEALELFTSTARQLRTLLGLTPSPRLATAHLAILNHEYTIAQATSTDEGVDESAAGRESHHLVAQAVVASIINPGLSGPSSRSRTDIRCERADSHAALGLFADAASGYTAAIREAHRSGDAEAVAQLCLRLATVTWDPEPGHRVATLIDDTIVSIDEPLLRAELRICRAGGLSRSGAEETALVDAQRLRSDLDFVCAHGTSRQASWAITRYRNCVAGIIPAGDSLRLAQRLIALESTDSLIVGHNDRATFSELLRMGRLSEARAVLNSMRSAKRRGEPAVNRFGVITARICWNLALGRFERVQRDLVASMEFRGRLGQHTLDQVVLGQSFWLARELGDDVATETHLDAARALWDSDRTTPLWAVSAAVLAGDVNRLSLAGKLMAEADGEFDIAALPRGSHKLPIQALASEILAMTDDARFTRLASRLYDSMRVNSDRSVLVGWPAVFLGSKHRFLAFAAIAAGEPQLAARHAERAIEDDRRLPALRARSLRARALVGSDAVSVECRRRAARVRERLVGRVST